jgi:amidase
MCGSLTSPASRNALYTLKPTPGSIPGYGIFCASPREISPGAMTRTARDLVDTTAVLMDRTFDAAVLAAGWAGLKVGILENCPEWAWPAKELPPDERVDGVIAREMEKIVSRIAAEGAHVTRNVKLPEQKTLTKGTCIDNPLDGSKGILLEGANEYLANFEPTYTLADIVAINNANRHYALPPEDPSQATLEELVSYKWPGEGPEQTPDRTMDAIFGRMRAAIEELGVDVLLSGDNMTMMTVATVSGSPVASFPVCGTDKEFNGRRVGVLALALPGQDELLLRVATAWNAVFPGGHEPPRQMVNVSGGGGGVGVPVGCLLTFGVTCSGTASSRGPGVCGGGGGGGGVFGGEEGFGGAVFDARKI